MADNRLAQGIAAVKAGRKAEARELLLQVIQHDWRNEMAWLWLSAAVDTDEQRRACLKRVLATDPDNDAAKWGLEMLAVSGDAQPLRAESPRRPVGASPGHRPALQPVAGARKFAEPVAAREWRRSAALVEPQPGRTGPGRTWVFLACVVIASLVLAVFLLAGGLGFVRLPPKVVAALAPLPTPTLTPEQTYARAMVPTLVRLIEWLNGPVIDFDTQMIGPLPDKSGWTYAHSLFSCWADQEACSEPALGHLREDLLPLATRVAEGGAELEVSLAAITPPESVQVSHNHLVSCVRYRVRLASAIGDFLTGGTLPRDGLDPDPCDLLIPAIDRVIATVQDNQ